MRTSLLLLAGALVSSAAQDPAPALRSACTTATPACTEFVTLGSGPARSLIYRTYALDARNDGIRRALIMVHGTNRNADHYFSTATAAAFLAGAIADTVVISPRVASAAGNCRDKLDTNEVSWSCTGDSWRSGGSAASHPDLTSFDFVDQIPAEAREQEHVPQPPRHRRRRPLGRRSVCCALPDGEPRARFAGRADHLRGREPVELCLAGGHAAAAGRRRHARQREARMEHGRRAHEVLVRRVRREGLRQLRSLALRFPEPNRRLHGEKPATSS
jgi:hypothetical protein